ncbi:MAG TPA: ribonuclease P protein component [Anaerolineales bacterium]|nr:ribonuclease P protein component [Anaerolineales bacterium]
MKRRFRLTRSTDFKRVRRSGRSYAHPLVVLYVLKSEESQLHVGVSAGLAVGNAVRRNRAKRLLREAMNQLIPQTRPGSDLLLIARKALPESDLQHTRAALSNLLERAGLFSPTHDA